MSKFHQFEVKVLVLQLRVRVENLNTQQLQSQ